MTRRSDPADDGGAPSLEELAAKAVAGDSDALADLVRRLEPEVYRLALRFLSTPADAADAAQEILVLVVTTLSSFEGRSQLRTWVFRVSVRWLARARARRTRFERLYPSLEALGEGLGRSAEPTETGPGAQIEQAVWREEVFVGCTQAMLAALSREHRLAFVLGDLLGLSGEDVAFVLEVSPETARQHRARARRRLVGFMQEFCGVYEPRNACRCIHQVGALVRGDVVDPRRLVFGRHGADDPEAEAAQASYRAVSGLRRSLALLRHDGVKTPRLLEPVLEALRAARPPLH